MAPIACDGHGVVLASADHDHASVRLEVISAGSGFDVVISMPRYWVLSD